MRQKPTKNKNTNKSLPKKHLTIASFNVRTLKENDKLIELQKAQKDAEIDIVGIGEVRRSGEGIIKTKNGSTFCYFGLTEGQRGVGFLINKKWSSALISFQGITERIALARIRISDKKTLTLIQVYAPTLAAPEVEVDAFYDELQKCINNQKINVNNKLLVMGDFNSQIGERSESEDSVLGPYGYGNRNERGEKLIDFCYANQLKIINTWFKKRKGKKWTWISPNLDYKNQIDFILAPRNAKNIKNFDVIQKFDFISDHRPIKCELTFHNWRNTPPRVSYTNKINDYNKVYYEQEINKLLINPPSATLPNLNGNVLNDWIKTNIIEASKRVSAKTQGKDQNLVGKDNFYKELTELKSLRAKRDKLRYKKLKTKEEKIELNLLCKLTRSKLRKVNSQKEQQKINEILDTTKSTKTIKKIRSLGTYLITYMEDDRGEKKYSRDEINKIATLYYSKLYDNPTKGSNNPTPKPQDLDPPEPNFLEAEIANTLKNLKNNKAMGSDGLANEQLKLPNNIHLIKHLTNLFNEVMKTQIIPNDWKYSEIILIHKKGNKHHIENYRPISLGSTISKIFSKLLEKRISSGLMEQQPIEQAGFRHGFSTSDHLFTLNQLIEKANEFQLELHLAFIDYKKAFDSLDHEFMIQALTQQGVPAQIVRIIQEMYMNLKAKIRTDILGPFFNIKKGVKQGDPLSPLIFSCALEQVFRNLEWEKNGIVINGKALNNLRFADDIVLIAKSPDELLQMIKDLNEKAQMAGLHMNMSKTKILSNAPQSKKFVTEETEIERVDEIKYLGQIISLNDKNEKEIKNRIGLGWKKFWSLGHILKGKFQNKHKIDIMNACVLPTITYGAQTWTLTQKEKTKLRVTQNSMMRAIQNVKIRDKIKITKLKNKMKGLVDVVHDARRKKWEWGGHIARVGDERWGYRLLNWRAVGKRKKGRQKLRWRDEFKNLLKNNLFERVAQNRAEWARLKENFAQEMGLAT